MMQQNYAHYKNNGYNVFAYFDYLFDNIRYENLSNQKLLKEYLLYKNKYWNTTKCRCKRNQRKNKSIGRYQKVVYQYPMLFIIFAYHTLYFYNKILAEFQSIIYLDKSSF